MINSEVMLGKQNKITNRTETMSVEGCLDLSQFKEEWDVYRSLKRVLPKKTSSDLYPMKFPLIFVGRYSN